MLDNTTIEMYEKLVELYKEERRPVTLTKLYKKLGWRIDKFKRNIKYLESIGFIKHGDTFQTFIPLKLEGVQAVKENGWEKWKSLKKGNKNDY